MPEYEVTIYVTVPETVLVSADNQQAAAAEAEYEAEMLYADAVETRRGAARLLYSPNG